MSEILDQIRRHSLQTQHLFYYLEDDQLKLKDHRGWSAVEYIEHFNMILYHQLNILKEANSNSKGINVSKILGSIMDSWGYKSIIRKSKTEFFFENFKPISVSSPEVMLNPQKVFQDVIYGCEEFIHLMENKKNQNKIVFDKIIPALLTFRGKAQFLAEYFGLIIHHCRKQI